MENFVYIIGEIKDKNILNQHHGIIGIRKILCVSESTNNQEVIRENLIPIMIWQIEQ
jgi:hypothetical protein